MYCHFQILLYHCLTSLTYVPYLFPGGGKGCACFPEEVFAAGECEEAAAATWKLLPFVLQSRSNLWRSAHAQAGGHIRAHDCERSSLHCYNHDEGQPRVTDL